jgi:hypothetical protein
VFQSAIFEIKRETAERIINFSHTFHAISANKERERKRKRKIARHFSPIFFTEKFGMLNQCCHTYGCTHGLL